MKIRKNASRLFVQSLAMLALASGGFRPAIAASFLDTGPLARSRSFHTATLLQDGTVLAAGGFGSGGFLASAEVYDRTSGTWKSTGSLKFARYVHTATLLPSGNVLVVGGNSGGVTRATAELYDRATATWTLTGSLNTARSGHTAVLLSDGKVLVAGGEDEGYHASVEIYDPATGLWTTTNRLLEARSSHTATLLPDGSVLVAGGVNGGGALSSAELYHPSSGTWTLTGNLMISPRHRHTATLLPNGKVLVAGGDTNNFALGKSELYDPATGMWSATGALKTSREHHSATLLPNGLVLIAGGDDNRGVFFTSAEVYNPLTGMWTATNSLGTARRGHTANLLPGGELLIAGGENSGGYLNSVEVDDWAIRRSTSTGVMNTPRADHTAHLLPNGKVLVVGNGAEIYDPAGQSWTPTGTFGQAFFTSTLLPNGRVLLAGGDFRGTSAALFDPATGMWTPTGSPSQTRYQQVAVSLADGRVLAVGGQTSFGSATPLAELYNPDTGSWSNTAFLNAGCIYNTATLLSNGKVLVAGGIRDDALKPSAELYDPATGNWTPTGSLNTSRYFHTATLLPNGRVLVAGGSGLGGSVPIKSAELYEPATGSWAVTGSLITPRLHQTATLLPDGKVLVTGGMVTGNNTSTTNSAEIYDPATGKWTLTGSLISPRRRHTATLLPNGKVLLAGGSGSTSAATNSTELFDAGLGFDASWRPNIAGINAPLASGGNLVLAGSRFRGISGASSGNSQDSPADYPVVQLRNVESGQTVFLPPAAGSPWSATSFTSAPLSAFPGGYALVTVMANGIPSVSAVALVTPPPPPVGSEISVLPGFRISILAPTNTINLQAIVGDRFSAPSFQWCMEFGAGQVVLTDPTGPITTAIFGFAGTYVLSVTATSGTNIARADVTVTVGLNPNGVFQEVANFVGGALLTSGNVFLTNFQSTLQDATNYYAAIDPGNKKTTLNDWKIANGMPTNSIPASTTNFAGVVSATYFNSLDLGFGRRMLMSGTNGNWAFSVSNYRTVEDAINDANKIATVTMDYSAVVPGINRFTKFYVYGANDARVPSADLDGGGEKFVPGLCVACHGGTTGTVAPGGGNVNAHFLPFDLRAFDYSCRSNFTRAAQEPAFKLLNLAVLAIEQDIAQVDPAHAAPALIRLIQGWYGNGFSRVTQQDEFVPEGWQNTGATNLLSLAGQAYLYRNVVATACRTCHVSRDVSRNLDFGSFTNFHFWAAVSRSDVYGSANLAPSLIYLNPDDAIRMPQARRTFQRFWNSISPRPQPEILRDYLIGALPNYRTTQSVITGVERNGSNLKISFTTAYRGSYRLEQADTLTNSPIWTPVSGEFSGIGNTIQVFEPIAPSVSNRFFRIRSLP